MFNTIKQFIKESIAFAKWFKYRVYLNYIYIVNRKKSQSYNFSYKAANPNIYYNIRLLNDDFNFNKLKNLGYLLTLKPLTFTIKADSKVKKGDRIYMPIIKKVDANSLDLNKPIKQLTIDSPELKYKIRSNIEKVFGGDNSLEPKEPRLLEMPFRVYDLDYPEAFVFFIIYNINKDPFNSKKLLLTANYLETLDASQIKFYDDVYVS